MSEMSEDCGGVWLKEFHIVVGPEKVQLLLLAVNSINVWH